LTDDWLPLLAELLFDCNSLELEPGGKRFLSNLVVMGLYPVFFSPKLASDETSTIENAAISEPNLKIFISGLQQNVCELPV